MKSHSPKSHGPMRALLKFSGLILAAGIAAALPARAATFDCVMDPAQKVKVGSSVTGVLKSVLVTRCLLYTSPSPRD